MSVSSTLTRNSIVSSSKFSTWLSSSSVSMPAMDDEVVFLPAILYFQLVPRTPHIQYFHSVPGVYWPLFAQTPPHFTHTRNSVHEQLQLLFTPHALALSQHTHTYTHTHTLTLSLPLSLSPLSLSLSLPSFSPPLSLSRLSLSLSQTSPNTHAHSLPAHRSARPSSLYSSDATPTYTPQHTHLPPTPPPLRTPPTHTHAPPRSASRSSLSASYSSSTCRRHDSYFCSALRRRSICSLLARVSLSRSSSWNLP